MYRDPSGSKVMGVSSKAAETDGGLRTNPETDTVTNLRQKVESLEKKLQESIMVASYS